ncbi:MAG: hypothetical protein AAF641_04180 [Pseudomonadota bacterium]
MAHMIRALSATLVLLISSGAGWSQSIIVRAGEHADFTRVVFNTPDRLDVALTYREDGIDLRFERSDLQFDIDTVFDVIPRNRLTAIDVETYVGQPGSDAGAGLPVITFSLACRCDIQTAWVGDTAFVVDISDETAISAALFSNAESSSATPAGPAAVPETPPDPEPTDSETASENEAQTLEQPSVASAESVPNLFYGSEKPSVGSVAFLLADAQERLQDLRTQPQAEPSAYSDRLRDSQGAILQQIGRAATQGLLEPRSVVLPDIPEPNDTSDPAAATSAQTTRANAEPMQAPPVKNISVNAQTSMDQAMSERLNITVGDNQMPGCLATRRVDVAAWAKEERFIDQIGDLRSNILGEFDEPSPSALKKLAQFYIHFGFGAEAAQVMTMLPEGKKVDPILSAMINILEDGNDGSASVLAGYMDCDPVVAVWSLLSYEAVPGNEPIDPDGIVRGIMNFPLHLRAYLGPIAGEKLRVAGYPRAADHIARGLLRNEDTTSTAAAFLDTLNDKAGPDASPSEADLGAVVADNGQPSAEALLKLINARLADETPMSEDMALLAGAYATELRDLPLGQDMARAYVLSLAASDLFEQAFAEFGRLTNAAPAPVDGTLSDLMDILTQNAGDPQFLTHTIGASSATRFGIDDAVGNAIAARLMTLGFPEEAGAFVAPLAQGAAERARKLIRAEIAILNNRPRQAELELLGESGADVQNIIARARSIAGEHAAAQQIFSQINANEDAQRQAFLDGDWEMLQSSPDPVIAAVAERQTEPAVEDEVSEVLARNTIMIEESQTMRTEIEALLAGVSISDGSGATSP